MINIYLIDYFNTNSTGLSTYINQLGKYLLRTDKITLHYIWIRAKEYKRFEKKIDNNIIHYYIPGEIASLSDATNYDALVAEYLAKELSDKKNIIFHFNWINHCVFAQLLKQKINCKTLLTMHCIPWRDLITNNYTTYRELNK